MAIVPDAARRRASVLVLQVEAVAVSPVMRVDRLDIGRTEIRSFEQQRLAFRNAERINRAVSEVKAGAMAALAERANASRAMSA